MMIKMAIITSSISYLLLLFIILSEFIILSSVVAGIKPAFLHQLLWRSRQQQQPQQQQQRPSRTVVANNNDDRKRTLFHPLQLRSDNMTNSSSSSTTSTSSLKATIEQQQQQQQQQEDINNVTTNATVNTTKIGEHVHIISEPSIQQQQQQQQTNTHNDNINTITNGAKKQQQQQQQQQRDSSSSSQETTTTTTTQSKVILHSYTDDTLNITLYGVNIPLTKFQSWIQYKLSTTTLRENNNNNNNNLSSKQQQQQQQQHCPATTSKITSVEYPTTPSSRNHLRTLWKNDLLISERTELLAVYASDKKNFNVPFPRAKRGGFLDLLTMYADRLIGILSDEKREGDEWLLEWLRMEYGCYEVECLLKGNMEGRSEEEQIRVFQHLLNWFRQQFPYYYDRCSTCHASLKDDQQQQQQPPTTNDDSDDDTTTTTLSPNSTFLGYVHPHPHELTGHATRTEIYKCHVCHSITRFPRYNAMKSIIQHAKGRCGEYSMLLYRLLRCCGHDARWVVDWSDHVWAEVKVGTRFVHLDPCEASVDMNGLYEGWGKEQVYIMAFWASSSREEEEKGMMRVKIDDVTCDYTSAGKEEIFAKREENGERVEEFIDSVERYLMKRLEEEVVK